MFNGSRNGNWIIGKTMLVKAIKEIGFDQMFEKVEMEELYQWFNCNRYGLALHPLRKILDETDAYILGKSLDMFHLYRCNRWKIDKAIRDRSFADLPKNFNPQEFLNLIVYHKERP